MPEATNVGTAPCILEPRPHIWDLGGTMTATFADKSNPDEPVGFINSNQVLQITGHGHADRQDPELPV
jgi:hypothetical protein